MDEFAKAYSSLSSLKRNVPHTVDQSWVNDFHSALDKVEKEMGVSLQDFRIPHTDLRPEATSTTNYSARLMARSGASNTVTYSGRVVMRRERFLAKLDAALGYLQVHMGAPAKDGIGFKA